MITNLDLSIMMFVQENLRSEIGNAIMKFITHSELETSELGYKIGNLAESAVIANFCN